MSGEKMPSTFDRDHQHRLSALRTVETHGDARTTVLLLCRVLAKLDRIEAHLGISEPD